MSRYKKNVEPYNARTKRYTYRSDEDIRAALNARGVSTDYSVVIEGVPAERCYRHYTLHGAKIEVNSHKRVFGRSGLVYHVPTGEVVYAVE
jgi:hypothetical protein